MAKLAQRLLYRPDDNVPKLAGYVCTLHTIADSIVFCCASAVLHGRLLVMSNCPL